MDRGVKKVHDTFKDQKLLSVPFDKGSGFCVMKEKRNSAKQNEILSASQLKARNGEIDD